MRLEIHGRTAIICEARCNDFREGRPMQRGFSRWRRNLAPVVAPLLLYGCTIPDRDLGLSVTRIDATTIRLTAPEGTFANDNASRKEVLLRAAEETLRYNRRSFMVVDPELVRRTQRFWAIDRRSPWLATDPAGPGDILIRMMSGPRGTYAPANIFDAEAIIQSTRKNENLE